MADPFERLRPIALDEFTRRQATADRKVQAGEIAADVARSQLRAWAAIAVICDAPIFEREIAEYRKTIVFYRGDGSPADYNYLHSEEEARSDLARDLCPAPHWRATLAKARDAALGRVGTPDGLERARNLCFLARALDVPLTLASCARPVEQRLAA